jgi:hypothetical protein
MAGTAGGDGRPRERSVVTRIRSPARATAPLAAAVLSLAVAWVHLAYAASHLRQWWAYGAFFVAAGAGQALFAPLVLRRATPAVAYAGIAGNAAIVGMYVLSRTAGPPLGPHARVPETAGPIDLATTAAEVVLVGVLLSLLEPRARRRVLDLLVIAAAALWALRLTGRLP